MSCCTYYYYLWLWFVVLVWYIRSFLFLLPESDPMTPPTDAVTRLRDIVLKLVL